MNDIANKDHKTAVVLFNLGGPDCLEAVPYFLFNLFYDKAIINLPNPFRFLLAKLISTLRCEKSKDIYRQINDCSPINSITEKQAELLEESLKPYGNYKVFFAMRYWNPRAEEVFYEINQYSPNRIILLPLYPQFSTTTSQSSISEFYKLFEEYQRNMKIDSELKIICCYPTEKSFIASHVNLIYDAIITRKNNSELLQKLFKNDFNHINQIRFLFSAHGLPQKIIDNGDPYVFLVEETVRNIIPELSNKFNVSINKIDYQICYQSKVGPTKWTSPSLEDAIKKASIEQKNIAIIPIAFVSEHSETLVELDIEYKNKAESLSINEYIRVPALNFQPQFIESLKNMCLSANFDSAKKCFSSANVMPNGDNKNNNHNYGYRICPNKLVQCPNFDFCEHN